MPISRRAAACLGAAVLLVACGDSASAPTPEPPFAFDDPRCAAIADECVHRQRGCWLDADTGTASCRPCPAGHYATGPHAGCARIAGTVLAHDFGELTLAPGEEIGSVCQSWVLDNDDELFINTVELTNGGGYHHSNWFFVPEDYKGWTTEPWRDCYRDGFHELEAALAGGVIYAQSTQVHFEIQKFQDGAAVRIPPRSRIIGATHLLNFHPSPLTTRLAMTLYALPPEDVAIRLVPAQFLYQDLAIPPEQVSYAGGECDLDAAHQNLFGAPLEMKVHYALAHYHDLGHAFDLRVIGGPEDGRRLIDHGAYAAEPIGFAFNPPVDLSGARGLAFGCAFDNPRDATVRRGIGDQEMCDALLFVESRMAFSASVGETTSMDVVDGIERHSGRCGVLAFPFATGAPEAP